MGEISDHAAMVSFWVAHMVKGERMAVMINAKISMCVSIRSVCKFLVYD